MAKKRRSCNFELYAKHRLGNEATSEVKRLTIATGSVSKVVGGLQFDAARRKARDHIKPCLESLWDQRQLDVAPTPCSGMHLGLESGETFLDHVADLVYEKRGRPSKGDILIEVRYRIWGDNGCGRGEHESMDVELGSIQIDLDHGLITSGHHQVEFKEATVGRD